MWPPPTASKRGAQMYIALDKMRRQAPDKTIVCEPETSNGGSFRSPDLTNYGFEADWEVEDKWNLCLTGDDAEDCKMQAFVEFMGSDAEVLVCTHATFRFGRVAV